MEKNRYFIIQHQGKPFKNKIFLCENKARNYIKMSYPTRRFREYPENKFTCSRYGTTFEIIELDE